MIISMLGGLAMFLYGMTLLGSGLEKTSGGRLERTLEKLTDTVIKGVLPLPSSPPLRQLLSL